MYFIIKIKNNKINLLFFSLPDKIIVQITNLFVLVKSSITSLQN